MPPVVSELKRIEIVLYISLQDVKLVAYPILVWFDLIELDEKYVMIVLVLCRGSFVNFSWIV